MAEATATKSDNVGVGATTMAKVRNNIDNSGGQRQRDNVGVGMTSMAKEVASLMIAMKRGKEAALVQPTKEEDGYGGCCQCRHRRGSGDGAVGSSVIKVTLGDVVGLGRNKIAGIGITNLPNRLFGDSGYDLEAEGSSDDSKDVREGLVRFYSDNRRRTTMIVRVGKKREVRTTLMARLYIRTLARGVLI
ncbi:hypothetical protein BHE74_00041780 [Ensete ventricosum]|nr:hypothetical protein BHE74_00041780 [Ensete ventricosum]RZR78806.1 hypothetical protein BHM03_00004340 [Ensete ventricosum]